MTTGDFAHIITVSEAGQGRRVTLDADVAARVTIAARLRLGELARFTVTADVRGIAGGIAAKGHIDADVVQSCAATALPVPAHIHERFDLRFLRDAMPDVAAEEEIEISGDDCDLLPLEDERVDLGEVAVQTLSLALNPFPRHPDADRVLAEKGVLTEEQAGPFGALVALTGKSPQSR